MYHVITLIYKMQFILRMGNENHVCPFVNAYLLIHIYVHDDYYYLIFTQLEDE